MENRFRDKQKILVVIRKRPLLKRQIIKNEIDIVSVKNYQTVIVSQLKHKVDLTKYIEEHYFNFDFALHQNMNNQELYKCAVRPLVEVAFIGAKVTCFAYGQTGSGKTYTMNGDPNNKVQGLYRFAAYDLFKFIQQVIIFYKKEFKHLSINVSFFQIYCGKLFDLLNDRQQLVARQDAKQNVNIVGLQQKKIYNVETYMQVIEQGSSVRITSSNCTNPDSSRSHSILQIFLKDNNKLFGKISFIDLAGSQRGADTFQSSKQTRIDGAQINKSLLALKQCIRALDQGRTHTPFRGSKLTMVLKDSFVGFSRTVMIGNISPVLSSCENTLNTLRYADRVKQLKKGVDSNNGTMTKQDILAKQLMLPRMMKYSQKYNVGSEEQKQDKPQRKRNQKSLQRSQKKMYRTSDDFFDKKSKIAAQVNKVTTEVNNIANAVTTNLSQISKTKIFSTNNNFNGFKIQDGRKKDKPVKLSDDWEEIIELYKNWQPKNQQQILTMSDNNQTLISRFIQLDKIMQEQEKIIELHKNNINENVEVIKSEMNLLQNLEKMKGSSAQYAQALQSIIDKKLEELLRLKKCVGEFRGHLTDQQECEKKLFRINQQFTYNSKLQQRTQDIFLLDGLNDNQLFSNYALFH